MKSPIRHGHMSNVPCSADSSWVEPIAQTGWNGRPQRLTRPGSHICTQPRSFQHAEQYDCLLGFTSAAMPPVPYVVTHGSCAGPATGPAFGAGAPHQYGPPVA